MYCQMDGETPPINGRLGKLAGQLGELLSQLPQVSCMSADQTGVPGGIPYELPIISAHNA